MSDILLRFRFRQAASAGVNLSQFARKLGRCAIGRFAIGRVAIRDKTLTLKEAASAFASASAGINLSQITSKSGRLSPTGRVAIRR